MTPEKPLSQEYQCLLRTKTYLSHVNIIILPKWIGGEGGWFGVNGASMIPRFNSS